MSCEIRTWLRHPPDAWCPMGRSPQAARARKASEAGAGQFEPLRLCAAGVACVLSRLPRPCEPVRGVGVPAKRLSRQYGCSEDEVERSLSVFNLADRSGDGFIMREEFSELVERTLKVELTPEELDRYWQDICPENGPQRIGFDEWFGWVRRNYLPFQELTVEAPVPESYELVTSALGVALAVYVLGHLDAVASFGGLGAKLTLWAPPLGSVVVLLFGPGLQGRRGALGDTEAVRTVLVACFGCALCALLALYTLGGEDPSLTRAAAASGSLLWMRATRSLFAPAGAFATLAVDESLLHLPEVRDLQWVLEGVQVIVVPAICGSLFLFAAQSAAVWLRKSFALQEPLSLQDSWLLGELRNTFPSLPKQELSKLLKEAEEVFYPPKAALTEQGTVNDYLWLVISGKLLVDVSGQVASTLERKAIIGEVTFLDPRDKLATATVYAAPNGARTLRWSQQRLREFCAVENSLGERLLSAISEELIEKMVRGRGAGRRSPEESLRLLTQLRRTFPQLGTAEVPRFLKAAESVSYTQNSCLTKQGEENKYLWLVLFGTLTVTVDSQLVAQLSDGALIGEATFLGFAEQGRATATVRSEEECLTQRLSQRELQLLSVTFQGASSSYQPMQLNSVPTEFECDNFIGRCMLLHRPAWSYDDAEPQDLAQAHYPYKEHFHGRKRLWEWRIQGRFKRRPGVLYCGVELERYVPVNFTTRTLMRGIIPLVQGALQCKQIRHEIGKENDPSFRPTVVAPIWAADNTLIHEDPSAAPNIADISLPAGYSRKAARHFWDEVWNGGGPSFEVSGGPIFTFAIWGPAQLLDLRAWVFRKLPLMWGRSLSLEPFVGKQPVHAVIYELCGQDAEAEHHQAHKAYVMDVRVMPEALWSSFAMGEETSSLVPSPVDCENPLIKRSPSCDSFCSALSELEDTEDRRGLLSPVSDLPLPLVRQNSEVRWRLDLRACCRRRRRNNFLLD
ncbi:unnamed protein product [Effrenium voratum]|nr:unnamed protein product [Effrenium voratum]